MYLVTWCGGAREVKSMRTAYKLAKSKASAFRNLAGCKGASVYRMAPDDLGRGTLIVECIPKQWRRGVVCKRKRR